MCIDPAKTYAAAIETSKGLITVDLDAKNAPKTVNNFVVLARYHFYDGLPFHRIAAGFVIQGGRPTATGSGGPGLQVRGRAARQRPYKIGTMAMANAGADTNGSQFFFVIGEEGVDVLQHPATRSSVRSPGDERRGGDRGEGQRRDGQPTPTAASPPR